MKFFVDIDRETIKLIRVQELPGSVFHAGISLLLDRGREVEVSSSPIKGLPALRRFLENHDVPRNAIIAQIGERPKNRYTRRHLSMAALLCLVVFGGGVALTHYVL